MAALKEKSISLLSTTSIALNANADTTLYTVPTGKTLILDQAILVVGANASTTTLSIGQSGATTDFIGANTLSNAAAANDAVILQPIPSTTPPKNKAYAAGTVIKATVAANAGGATNTIYLFGFLF